MATFGMTKKADGDVPVIKDEAERTEYLNRAKRQLLRETRV